MLLLNFRCVALLYCIKSIQLLKHSEAPRCSYCCKLSKPKLRCMSKPKTKSKTRTKSKNKPSVFATIVDYIQKHWVVKASLWLATITVSIIAIWQFFKSGPDIELIPHHTIVGYSWEDSSLLRTYTADISITNKGDKAYFPRSYQLIVKWKDTAITFDSRSIPKDAIQMDLGPMKTSLDPNKDLTRVEKIEPDGIVTGFVYFTISLSRELFRRVDFLHYETMKFIIYSADRGKWESKEFLFSDYKIKDSYSPQGGIETQKN